MSPTTPATIGRTTPTRVGPVFIAAYALAMFGIWMAINLPATVTLALRISEIDPAGKTTSYSIAAGVGTLTAVLANPFFGRLSDRTRSRFGRRRPWIAVGLLGTTVGARSEEHTSELQSRQYLVCRLLLEKKNSTTVLPYPRTPVFARIHRHT